MLEPGYDVTTDGDGGFMPDQVSYEDAPAGVSVDLGAGTASGDGDDALVLGGRVILIGTPHDDVLTSGELSDDIWAGEGADVLRGGPGRDYLLSDPTDLPSADDEAWDDRVYGGPGGDAIYTGNGDDVLRGGSGNDSLVHGYGRADLVAGGGDDHLETVYPFADRQQVRGGNGVDEAYVWAVVSGTRRLLDVEGRIDLGQGTPSAQRGARIRQGLLDSIERQRIPDGTWTVIGTDADETFYGGELRRSGITVRAG